MNTHDSLVASARSTLDQPPPPTLREILAAYRSKGDGDRDMLLAMLNAKAAEDQVCILPGTFLLYTFLHLFFSAAHRSVGILTSRPPRGTLFSSDYPAAAYTLSIPTYHE